VVVKPTSIQQATHLADEAARADRWCDRDENPHLIAVLQRLADLVERHHPTHLEGLERLPDGPALLVGNHGHLGYETLLFFHALLRSTGRLPRGLADRWFFRVPLVRDVLVRIGGAYGHPNNAHRLLAAGHWVVCYPGGAREVLKRRSSDRYTLRWEVSRGFVRVAQETGVPIIPFAAAGVDDTFEVQGALQGTGELLMGHAKYDLPRLRGGRCGLPRAVPFLFRFGAPVDLAREMRDAPPGEDAALRYVHRRIWKASQRHLDETVASWRARFAMEAA
jgi:1-acyl-sn-glycerol-3-phosphate acyltransferase